MRKVISWNKNWMFIRQDLETKSKDHFLIMENEPEEWESVNVPHTWNALDGQDGGGDYYQGAAWYKKEFELDAENKKVFLRFQAVNKKAQVWCNKQFVGEHLGGFSAFTVELSDAIREGKNELLVRADNGKDLPTYPSFADFTFFGGIYRDVDLIMVDEESFVDMKRFGTDGLWVIPDVSGEVQVRALLHGNADAKIEIFDHMGNCVSACRIKYEEMDLSKRRLFEEETDGYVLETALKVEKPLLWQGLENPVLYHVRLTLLQTDAAGTETVLDVTGTDFGFRSYHVTADSGFYLNHASYPLHGVCRHQDRENMGWAITQREHLEDMALIREIGANTIRLAHYQQAEYFYDLCDRNGMVVWAEIPFISIFDTRKEANQNIVQQMKELVVQNFNHPSICFWGIANELGIGGESEEMLHVLEELNALTKALDPNRLTVIANVGMTQPESRQFAITDVCAYNEYMGWYEGKKEGHGSFFDERHAKIPNIPLAVSEYGADSVLKWHSEEPKVKDYTEEYQAILHECAYQDFIKRPYLYASWLWNMFDFAADNRDEGGSRGKNNKGLVTHDRKIKKDAFYFYKAMWSKEPFVYICGKRFLKRAGDTVEIKVYSNAKEVSLRLNQKYQTKSEGEGIFIFENLPLSEGFNEIRVCTENGLSDVLILEKVEEFPEEYTLKEEKNISEAVQQWFANAKGEEQIATELFQYDGYLSVFETVDDLFQYPQAYEIIQDLVTKPLELANPQMADRMKRGGGLSFHSIWNFISKQMPDELIYIVNERLNKIKK